MNIRRRAFSLIEAAVVLLIVGILVAGVLGGKELLKKSRISSARTLTAAAPVLSISDLSLWLESSTDFRAFNVGNSSGELDGSSNFSSAFSDGDAIIFWGDFSYNQQKKRADAVGLGAKYSNSINFIQAVSFEGSSSNYLRVADASFLNGTDYTVFVVEKRLSNAAGYFIGDVSLNGNSLNQNLLLGYKTDFNVVLAQGSGSESVANIEGYADDGTKARMSVFSSSSFEGKKIYVNGTLAVQNQSDKSQLSNISQLVIGKGYTGEIGEVIIFTRALNNSERKSVEDYLTKKWNVPNNRDKVADCTQGTLTADGCIQQCQVSVVGSSDNSPRNDGDSGEIECDQSGYDSSDEVEYTCSNGQTITGTCGCASGYQLISGTCQLPSNCSGLTILGSNVTSVNHGQSTAISCNQTGYTGSMTGYSCNNGVFTAGTACACDTANFYEMVSGVCQLVPPTCSIPTNIGVSETGSVNQASGSLTCSTANHFASGSLNYTCARNGTLTITSTPNKCACDTAANYEDDGNGGCRLSLPFVSAWNTANTSSGSSTSNQVRLPLVSTGTYNFTVNWGDGNTDTITSYNQSQVTHTYASSGSYTISISGTIRGFVFNGTGDRLKITNISQWGPLRLGTSEGNYFNGAANLTITATDILDTTGLTSLYQAFLSCTSLTTIPNIGSWNVSSVTNMQSLFRGATNADPDVTNWNVSNVTILTGAFYASSFNRPIGSWNVSNATGMNGVFNGASKFNQNIGAWTFNASANTGNLLANTTSMSVSNYNLSLYGWATNSLTPNGRSIASSSKYNSTAGGVDGAWARNYLISTKGWTISDGGVAP